MGMPVIDLFTSRLCNQIGKCFASKPDPHSLATDAMQQEWNQEIQYAYSPFSLIQRVLCKIAKEKVSNIDNSSMENSTLVSKSSCNVIFSTLSAPDVCRRSEEAEKGRPPPY